MVGRKGEAWIFIYTILGTSLGVLSILVLFVTGSSRVCHAKLQRHRFQKKIPCNTGEALFEERAVSIYISVYLFWTLPLLFPVLRVTLGLCAISGFRRKADENCAVPGYYAASSGNFLPTFRDQRSGIVFLKGR
jgi:hypothetical protein